MRNSRARRLAASKATDPIIKDHQLWIGFVQPEGLVVSPAALKNAQAVLSHNVGTQQEILRRHAVPDFDSNLRLKNFRAFTQEFWGWRESDLAAPPADLCARLPEYGERCGPPGSCMEVKANRRI